jgi:hypothetical protein
MVQLVLLNFRIKFGELIIHLRRGFVVLDLIIAVSKQRKCRSISWRVMLELNAQDVDHLG